MRTKGTTKSRKGKYTRTMPISFPHSSPACARAPCPLPLLSLLSLLLASISASVELKSRLLLLLGQKLNK
jgi:hypothetical protein